MMSLMGKWFTSARQFVCVLIQSIHPYPSIQPSNVETLLRARSRTVSTYLLTCTYESHSALRHRPARQPTFNQTYNFCLLHHLPSLALHGWRQTKKSFAFRAWRGDEEEAAEDIAESNDNRVSAWVSPIMMSLLLWMWMWERETEAAAPLLACHWQWQVLHAGWTGMDGTGRYGGGLTTMDACWAEEVTEESSFG